MKKYVWIKPDLSFSASWTEDEHKKYWPEGVPKNHIGESGWRLMSFEIEAGSDFDFPYDSILNSKPKQ